MERNKEVSASAIPKYLIYLTMAFVLMRLSAFAFQIHQFDPLAEKKRTSPIAWMDFNRSLKRAQNVNSEEPKKAKKKEFGNAEEELLATATEIIEKQRAGANKKSSLTLLQFYSPDSDPCLVMEKETLTNSQVANYLQKNYFPVRVTYSRKDKSSTDTLMLTEYRRHYRVCAFPTLVVVDGEGEMVANLVGNCSSLTTYRFLTRTVAQAESRDSAENRKVVLN